MQATFFFDPACPWTWRASRWLVTVAPERDLTVQWRAFSLSILNEGEVPDEYRSVMQASTRALRLVEALRADRRTADIATFYTELGTRSHDAGQPLSDEIVLTAAEAAGVADPKTVLDDETWDEQVRESHEAALAAAGPDIGSPVLTLEGTDRGLHGPVLAAPPARDEAVRIFDALVPLLRSPVFFEVKRGRR